MNIQIAEWTLLNDQNACSITYLCAVSGLSEKEINDLIDHDLITPIDDQAKIKNFPLHSLVTANNARRLRDDFELDNHGMILALTLTQRINDLQMELKLLRAQFK